MFWLAVMGLPLIGGLHRFVASYGYRGVSKCVAWDEAWKTAAMLSVFSLLFAWAKVLE